MSDNTTLNLSNNINVLNRINLANYNTIEVSSNNEAILNNLASYITSNLIKEGNGELSLTSGCNHQGLTNLNTGSLVLKDASLGGDVTIATGAKLKGTGYLLSKLINNGVVAPGASPGIIRVSGDYLQSPGGTLEVIIKPSTNPVAGVDYSQISVEGEANINGSNLIVNAEDGSYIEDARYDIVTANGGVNGVFSNYTLNVSNFYYSRLSYDRNKVFLQFSRDYLPTHNLDNNSSIANYINSLNHISPGLIRILHPLFDMESKALNYSLRSISPNRNLVANYISQDVTNLIHSISNTRLNMTHNKVIFNDKNINNLSFSNIGSMSKNLYHGSTRSHLMNQVMNNLENNLLRSDKHYVWFTPFGQFVNVDIGIRNYGYDAKVGGMAIGYDYKVSDSVIGGLSTGYSQSVFNHKNNQGSDNKIKSTFISLYGSKQLCKGYVKGSLVGSVNKNNLNRKIHIGDQQYETNSSHRSYIVSPRVEIGYYIKENYDYQIIPFAATEYTIDYNKSYKEKGTSPLNMRIKSGKSNLITSELGIKLRKAINLSNEEELVLRAKLSYVNKQRSKKTNKIKAGFTEQTQNYEGQNFNNREHQISPGVSVELHKENGLNLILDYYGEISKSNKNHTIRFQTGMEF